MNEIQLSDAANQVELCIAELNDATDAERAAVAMDKVKLWIELGKALKAQLDEAMIRFIKTNGPVVIGPVRYYVGAKKSTKCRDVGETAKTMLELGGPELLRDVLSSGAFKYGECRKRLVEIGSPEQFERLFETTEEETLENGKPTKKDSLLAFDERFKR